MKKQLQQAKHANLACVCACVRLRMCMGGDFRRSTANPEEYKKTLNSVWPERTFLAAWEFLRNISTFTGEREEKWSTAATGKCSHSCFFFPSIKKKKPIINNTCCFVWSLIKERKIHAFNYTAFGLEKRKRAACCMNVKPCSLLTPTKSKTLFR